MGIRGKLVLATVALALFVSVGPVTFSLQEHRKVVQEEFQRRALVQAQKLALQLSEVASKLGTINDPDPVERTKRELDVMSAHVLNADGFILNDGSNRRFKNERLASFELVRNSVVQNQSFASRREGNLIHVSGPVAPAGEVLGYVSLIVTMDRAHTMVQRMLIGQVIILASLIAIGAVLAYAIAHVFRQPIKWLLDGVDAIRKGNYTVEIPVRSRDELAALASTINDVASHLRATTVSKRYLDEVLQSMVDTLVVVDTDANIVTVNRATIERLGYPEKQLIGQPASLICIDEGYQLTGSRLNHLLGNQTQQDHELHYRTSDGDLIPISFSGSPIRDNTGEIVGYVCIGKDITERKRAESEREHLNQKIVETSRQAGMAEVATGVLHNVGNVLNSVNMSASLVVDTVKRSKVAGLTKAMGLIGEHKSDLSSFLTEDDRGKQLPDYLIQLSEHLSSEQMSIIGELDSLTNNINHIKEIINMQQSYSKVTGVMEAVNLGKVVDEALRLNAVAIEKHGIQVRRVVDYVPDTFTDRHKILQILVNLVANAKDAMADRDETRILTVRLFQQKEDQSLVIEVSDTGHGIANETMKRIFTHGFTTKQSGHGFGLHSAALAAKELGGSLTANSNGEGHGATFTLSIPLNVAEVAA
jgi:PAS domain S-box-containing protein